MTLAVAWNDKISSKFPGFWLRVMAPLVGRSESSHSISMKDVGPKGWLADTSKIPEISYRDIFPEGSRQEEASNHVILRVLNKLLDASSAGIVRIVDLPEPKLEDERNHKNNFSNLVLKLSKLIMEEASTQRYPWLG